MDYKPGICTFCGTGCGHMIKVKDGSIAGVFASQNHPVSKGRLCVRGWNIHEMLGTHKRIVNPAIKKDGEWRAVSYDEAIAFIADRVKENIKNKSEEIAFLGSPRSSNEENFLLMKLARSVCRTNNISLHSESGHRNSLNVLNDGAGFPGMTGSLSEVAKAEVIVTVGFDITKQNPIVGSEIHMAVRGGAKLVAIDSRTTQITKLSSTFIQTRPGSTKVLMAALAKSVIEQELVDSNFIDKYTTGFEGFANSLGPLTYSDITAKTGIAIDVIKETAKLIAKAKSAMVFFPSGISGLDQDTIGYIYNLFMIMGKVGKEGCSVNPVAGLNNLQGGYDMGVAPDLLTGFQPISDKGVLDAFNRAWSSDLSNKSGRMVADLLSDSGSSIKTLFVVDHDDGIIRNADRIKKIDTVVYIGAFENPFTEYANVVLPIASYVETDGSYTSTERRVQLSTKKVDSPNGVLPGWKVIAMLAEKIGSKWNYQSSGDIMTEIASLTPAYSKITHEKLKNKLGGIQWPCNTQYPDGSVRLRVEDAKQKIKFVFVSGDFNVPVENAEFPYLLMVGKAQHYWHQNNLMKKTYVPMREYNATLLLFPEGYVELNPADAKEIGVREKWPVRVVSPFGSMKAEVKVSSDVKQKTAYVPYFVQDMISKFLLTHKESLLLGEDATISVRIEKV